MVEVSPVELQKYLSGVNYPARRGDLVEHASRQGADENILNAPRNEREYNGPSGVSQEITNTV